MTAQSHALHGLYVLTPDLPLTSPPTEPDALILQVAAAIAGGARLIQYRDKNATAPLRASRAAALLALCRAAEVPLIINDDLALAEQIGADGVHLGRDDADPALARRRLGTDAIIGVSCYDSLDSALAAEQAGASYVAFGSFFPSPTKPQAVRPPLALLTAARTRLRIPPVAIGGITPQNGGLLIAAGARMLAVITGLFAQPDVADAARAYSRLFIQETAS